MAIPMYDRENQVFGVAVAYNKVTGFFVKEDEVVMESLVHQASNSIQQFQLLIRATWEQQKTKVQPLLHFTSRLVSFMRFNLASYQQNTNYCSLSFRVIYLCIFLIDLNKTIVSPGGNQSYKKWKVHFGRNDCKNSWGKSVNLPFLILIFCMFYLKFSLSQIGDIQCPSSPTCLVLSCRQHQQTARSKVWQR